MKPANVALKQQEIDLKKRYIFVFSCFLKVVYFILKEFQRLILLMEEILHHLGCMKPL